MATAADVGTSEVRLGSVADGVVATYGGAYPWVRPDADDLKDLAELVERGSVRVEVERVFPMEETAAAHELSASGRVRGKIVIRVS